MLDQVYLFSIYMTIYINYFAMTQKWLYVSMDPIILPTLLNAHLPRICLLESEKHFGRKFFHMLNPVLMYDVIFGAILPIFSNF